MYFNLTAKWLEKAKLIQYIHKHAVHKAATTEDFKGFCDFYLNGNCLRSGADPLNRKKLGTIKSIFS